MRQIVIFALSVAALLSVLTITATAHAESGAFAYDAGTAKYGFSWNEKNQRVADAAAMKGCPSQNCKVVFRTGPQECGALATSDSPKESSAWGGAVRGNKEEAEARAVADCKKHTSGQCKVRASACNR